VISDGLERFGVKALPSADIAGHLGGAKYRKTQMLGEGVGRAEAINTCKRSGERGQLPWCVKISPSHKSVPFQVSCLDAIWDKRLKEVISRWRFIPSQLTRLDRAEARAVVLCLWTAFAHDDGTPDWRLRKQRGDRMSGSAVRTANRWLSMRCLRGAN
jgi:hypothetical protein